MQFIKKLNTNVENNLSFQQTYKYIQAFFLWLKKNYEH